MMQLSDSLFSLQVSFYLIVMIPTHYSEWLYYPEGFLLLRVFISKGGYSEK